MSILFTQNFDIIQEKEEEYGEFIAQTYVPQMNAMGLTSVGGYYVEIGFGPRVIGVHASKSLDELSHILTSKEYKELALQFKSFVYNYRNAAMEPLGKIKQEEYTIQKNVWKLNQYYDLRPGMKEAYKDFIINEHLPAMGRIDYVEVTGGWNVILGGVSEIIAEFTVKDPIDIGRLMNNEDFRKITLKLRNRYIRNYASRVLRCTERFDEPRWFRL
ncbi:MAG: hypothetical protein A4E63_02329 [Syntrophorhabdus sp. PtaU1.Bin050]|nr:MAG: hypothetical protein A4E63_02329 [Syntrophorhabdus sp. PtaU1.Bin050]